MSSLIYYSDVNSNLSFTDTSGVLDVLIVETPASLSNNLIAPQLNRDTTHWGKLGDTLSIVIENVGQATARITASDLDVVTGSGYAQGNIEGTLLGISLPTDLAGGDSLLFQYRINYPASPGVDDAVQYQVLIDYEDGNDPLASFNFTSFPPSDTVAVLTPPSLSFASDGLSPDRVEPNTTNAFNVKISNTGSTPVILDPASTLFRILSGTDTITATLISPLTLFADSTTDLSFDSALVYFSEGTYLTEIQIVGSFNDDSLNQTITTGQLQVGGDIQITSLLFPGLPPIPFFQLGEQNALIRMSIENFRTDTLQIDSALTTLVFRDAGTGSQISSMLFNLRRADNDSILLPQTITELDFEFDIPASGLDLGRYWIQGLARASNGIDPPFDAQTADDFAQFNITSGAELNYQANSLVPELGIPNQNIQFSANVGNTGLANVQLIADSSWLRLRNAVDSLETPLDANYGIPAEDTVSISFSSTQIPNDFPAGIYNLAMRLRGTLENGDPYDTTLVADSQFTTLIPAELVLDSFAIQPTAVVRGTEGIPAVIRLTNTGESVANLTTLALQFRDSSDNNVNNQWVVTGSSETLPTVIDSGQTITIFDTLSLSAAATLGPIRAGVQWVYNDTLIPGTSFDSTRLNLDTVNVITPGQIFIESTTIAGLPNLPNANTNQAYTVRTRIRNNGQDDLQDIKVKLFRNDVPFDSVAGLSVSGDDTLLVVFPTQATATTGLLTYRTQIDLVVSSTTGDTLTPDQPLDNTETVQVQTPALLSVGAVPVQFDLALGEDTFNYSDSD